MPMPRFIAQRAAAVMLISSSMTSLRTVSTGTERRNRKGRPAGASTRRECCQARRKEAPAQGRGFRAQRLDRGKPTNRPGTFWDRRSGLTAHERRQVAVSEEHTQAGDEYRRQQFTDLCRPVLFELLHIHSQRSGDAVLLFRRCAINTRSPKRGAHHSTLFSAQMPLYESLLSINERG